MIPTFDASGLDDLPLEALRSLQIEVGDFMLLGKVAIDIVARSMAQLPPDRLTRDVDIAVPASSRAVFAERVAGLEPGHGNSYRFRTAGTAVDVLPFGGLATDEQVVLNDDHLDVAGIADADRTAVLMDLGEGVVVRVASLPALIALKLIAWDVRGARTEDKDARDLVLLLHASISGSFEVDLWRDTAALEAVQFDAHRAGPYRAGRAIREAFEDHVLRRLVTLLQGERGAHLRSILSSPTGLLVEQLDALLLGLEGGT